MRFSSFVDRIAGEGAAAWDVHVAAIKKKSAGEDIIMLSVGDPDFDTPPAIVDRAVEALRAGRHHYGEVIGDRDLRAAIAEDHARRSGQNVGPAHIVVMSGAQNALFAAALCLLDRGDEILVPEPAYVTYEAVIGASGARMVHVPLRAERDFALDPADLVARIGPSTRAMLINSPNNPSGAVIPRATWEVVAELCRRHDLWLISDEVYGSVLFEGEHVSPGALPGMAERTVTINSLSKSHAMTGWRIGWAVAPEPLAAHLGRLALAMLYGVPPFIQDAAKTALLEPPAEIAGMKEAYRRRRDLALRRLGNLPGLRCVKPAGGMFVMVDVRGTGQSAQDFSWGLLESHGVSVLSADAFGPSAAGHIRISLGNSDAELGQAFDRIEAFIEGLTARQVVRG